MLLIYVLHIILVILTIILNFQEFLSLDWKKSGTEVFIYAVFYFSIIGTLLYIILKANTYIDIRALYFENV